MARRTTYTLLWIFVWTIPLQNIVVLPTVGSLSRGVGMLAGLAGVLTVAMEGRDHRLPESHVLVLVYAVWMCLTFYWSTDGGAARTNIISTLQFVAMVLLVWEFARAPRDHRGLLWAYVAGGLAAAVSLVASAVGGSADAVRLTVPGSNENAVALTLALGISIAWYLGATTPRLSAHLASRLYVVLAVLAIMLTGSRSGLILSGVALLVVPLVPVGSVARSLGVVAVGAALTTVAVLTFVPSPTLERLGTTQQELTSGSIGSREVLWAEAVDLFAERPWLGRGPGQSAALVAYPSGEPAVPHNTYLSIAGDTGVVGLALFLLIVLSIGLAARGLPSPDRAFLLVMALTLAIGANGLHWAYVKVTWLVIALAANHRAWQPPNAVVPHRP